jgi:hypothetical protein
MSPIGKVLGRYAWSPTVKRSGLWNREFVGEATMSHAELRRLEQLVGETPGAPSRTVADLTSTLLLIPCSASKTGWPDPQLPVKRVGDLIGPELAQVLEEGRHLAFARTSIDLASPTRPAIATYSGFPYATPGLRELLVSHLRRGLHCLIVSGGYGLVRPEEPITSMKPTCNRHAESGVTASHRCCATTCGATTFVARSVSSAAPTQVWCHRNSHPVTGAMWRHSSPASTKEVRYASFPERLA